MTYDTKGIWRFYEIKVSKSDFYSSAKKTFLGHFNYFVMPAVLYEEVKNDIPPGIGVITEGIYSTKKAKKQDLLVDEKVLKDSLIRSLAREAQKLYKSEDPEKMNKMDTRIRRVEKDRDEWRSKFQRLKNYGYEKYGRGWDREDT